MYTEFRHCFQRVALGATAVLLASCVAPPPAPDAPEGAPPDFPTIDRSELSRDAEAWAVDPEQSSIRALVYRGGALARLGHDHVLDARDVGGRLWIDAPLSGTRQVRGDFYVALTSFEVDAAASRAEVGFDTEPDAEDKDGTRRNMLASMKAAANPYARVLLSADAPADMSGAQVDADVTVRLGGGEHSQVVPIDIEASGDTLTGSGTLPLKHADLGIEPFSVMGGALAVKGEIEIRFRIVANRR